MAGGATYSEARACYEISESSSKDIFLATSHMLTPGLFLRQLGDLSVDKRKLDIPAERPKPVAPAHLFEREKPPPATTQQAPQGAKNSVPLAAATTAFANMSVKQPPQAVESNPTTSSGKAAKKEKEKKRHHFFR